jgi:hypothetical protein
MQTVLATPTTTMATSTPFFEYNISFTTPANPPSCEPKLTAKDLWSGIARVADTPQEYAPYVSKCEVLSRNGHALERKLTMANGAVHKSDGEIMYQDVWIADRLLVAISLSPFTPVC